MTAVGVTFGRTVGRARHLLSTAVVAFAFLLVAAVSFAFAMEDAEGGRLTLPVVWAASVSPILPILASLLSMDVWSEERQSGRVDMLLSVAVRERSLVLGKFLGVWTMSLALVVLFLLSSLVLLSLCAPVALGNVGAFSFPPAFFALALQSFLWSAAGVAFSAICRRPLSAACLSLVAMGVLPRALWAGLMSWSEKGRTVFGEMPLDAHVVDIASGTIPLGTIACYVVFALICLFVATKSVARYRFLGRGALMARISTMLAVMLALVLGVLTVGLVVRVNPIIELSETGVSTALSPKTRTFLAEASGNVTLTCFLPRKDVRFREVGRFLRLLRAESEAVGGVRFELQFVDPHWDFGAAERLVRQGVMANSLVVTKGRRQATVPLDKDFGERVCVAAIRRVTLPPQRRNVFWTTGHGECAFDAYDAFGMSDIARELLREGFVNKPIDLTGGDSVPNDCAMILIAGAREEFSRAEIGRLDAYLRGGGRLMVLLASAKTGGVVSMLPAWGIRPVDLPIKGKTLTGSDVIVSTFSDHPISTPLQGARIVFERPVSFDPSAAAGAGGGADRIGYTPVAQVGAATVVAAVERGGGAGRDLALRPTRIVAIGDASFAQNGSLAARANANRDFFLNCAAYLSGSGAYGSDGEDRTIFQSGLDRKGAFRLLLWTALAVPSVVFLVLLSGVFRRRCR